jgi:hypothetical protein
MPVAPAIMELKVSVKSRTDLVDGRLDSGGV